MSRDRTGVGAERQEDNRVSRRIERTRRLLITGAVLRALLLGAGCGLAIIAISVLVDMVAGLPRGLRTTVLPIAIVAAVATAGATLWRHRHAFALRRVARWVEECEPSLGFALLAALDRDLPFDVRSPLEARIDAVRWEPMAGRRVRRALVGPFALVGILAALLMLVPSTSRARMTTPTRGDIIDVAPTRGADEVDPLSPIVVTVTPPAYAGRSTLTLENPVTIGGLAGSVVTLRGRSAALPPAVTLDATALPVAAAGAREWSTQFPMPQRPGALRLSHRTSGRVLVLEPVIDSVPLVTLDRPATDTVLLAGRGEVAFTATLRDDIGIAAAGLEYIVSSGSGESFTFRSGTLASVAGANRRVISFATRVSLDALALEPGDIVHFRVFARDGNTVSGPSTGFSETRAIRIARSDERDSVAVDAAPPAEADGSLVSQRMLIILTEALQARRARLTRAELVSESRRLAADQKKLRRTVGDIIFTRLGTEPDTEHVHGPGETHEEGDRTPAELLRAAERANRAGSRSEPLDFHGDESPVVAINRPLLEAYNHMWDASRELDVAEPGRALPPMRAALAAIQRARQAERIYLRGRVAPVIVDVTAARLQGKDTGAASRRSPRAPLERERDLARFAGAVERLGVAPDQSVDSLLLLRVELLADHPLAARSLGEAIDLLRRGGDATPALAAARRALLGEPVVAPGLGRWSGGW